VETQKRIVASEARPPKNRIEERRRVKVPECERIAHQERVNLNRPKTVASTLVRSSYGSPPSRARNHAKSPRVRTFFVFSYLVYFDSAATH
jgi:hypothetical protein